MEFTLGPLCRLREQRTQILRLLEIILLIALPLHIEGETEAQRVLMAYLGSHRMLVAELGLTLRIMPTYHQFVLSLKPGSGLCAHHPVSQPLLPLMEASLSFPVGAREDRRVSGSELGEVF